MLEMETEQQQWRAIKSRDRRSSAAAKDKEIQNKHTHIYKRGGDRKKSLTSLP